MKKNRGISLIEVITSLTLITVLAGGLYYNQSVQLVTMEKTFEFDAARHLAEGQLEKARWEAPLKEGTKELLLKGKAPLLEDLKVLRTVENTLIKRGEKKDKERKAQKVTVEINWSASDGKRNSLELSTLIFSTRKEVK